jgi:hypothetical protein
MQEEEFIAFDYCGWSEQYGRLTHVPTGETLVCKSCWGQQDWDIAQATFFDKFLNIKVYDCAGPGSYRPNDKCWGTTEYLAEKLRNKWR